MKKILIATDFSANAKHAAEYGYTIASQVKAGIILCNTFIVPAEMPRGAPWYGRNLNMMKSWKVLTRS